MMMYDNQMICQYCDKKADKRNERKRMITPPLSPRPDKCSKPINEIIEDLPPPDDPIESMELDEPTIPTYAQIASTSKDIIPTKPQKKYIKCINCERDTKDNHKKSQMTRVNINEFTLLCEKCTTLKENQE